jgi:hypothetical protein
MSAEACFDPRVAPIVWQDMQNLHASVAAGPEAQLPEWASTHPTDNHRRYLATFCVVYPVCRSCLASKGKRWKN